MKTLKLLFVTILLGVGVTACHKDVYVENVTPGITLNELVHSYDIWYVDINQSNSNGQIPFMQIAFTLSFRNGVVYANNNLVGLGYTGNGYGIDVGYYDVYDTSIVIDHDLDGVWNFSVEQLSNNKIELYNHATGNSFILIGYQRSTFDYDYVFYDNIQYFLQEYDAWEKVYTSQQGAVNEFDEENYLAFLTDNGGDTFLSSVDAPGLSPSQVYWDYEGVYEVLDISGSYDVKALTLDYDYLGNEYFELYVIDDETIELYHPYSGTTYRFKGRGFIQYMKSANGEEPTENRKLRIKRENRVFDKNDFKSLNI